MKKHNLFNSLQAQTPMRRPLEDAGALEVLIFQQPTEQ